MISVFTYAFQAVASISLLSILGYILKRKGVFDDGFSKRLNSLVFRYFLSVNLFLNVYNIEDLSQLPLRQMLFCLIFTLFLFSAGMLVSPRITGIREKQSVLTQCFFRSNAAIIGLPIAGLLGGPEAEHYAAMFLATTVILFNALAVICFTVYSPDTTGKQIHVRDLSNGIVHNPLIIGLSLGLLCVAIRSVIPKNPDGIPVFSLQYTLSPLYNALKNLSQIASPLMLVLLGARFNFHSVSSDKKLIAIGVSVRVLIAPILGYTALFVCSSILHLFETSPAMYQGLIGILASPCAVSSAVMAAEMGGDETLASQLVVWSTLISMFSLFFIVFVLRMLGLM